MDIKKGVKLGVAGVAGIVGLIFLVCLGIFLSIFLTLFWGMALALITGQSSYILYPSIILGIISAIGLIWVWLSDKY